MTLSTLEVSSLLVPHWLAWLTTLARAFVLPVLGCALLLTVAPRLPSRVRRAGPALVRAALVLLVLAAYGPLVTELAAWGPADSPLYRAASLVVLVCALALVVVLPMLAESLGSAPPVVATRRVLPSPPPRPRPRASTPPLGTTFAPAHLPRSPPAEVVKPPPEAPAGRGLGGSSRSLDQMMLASPCPPYPGRPANACAVFPAVTFAPELARARQRPPPVLAAAEPPPRPPPPVLTAQLLELAPEPTVPEALAEQIRTLDEDPPAAGPSVATLPISGVFSASFSPPRIPPVRPEETVRVLAVPSRVIEPLPPTQPMMPSAQARLVAAITPARATPLQAPLRQATTRVPRVRLTEER
jgi:hypothetical protein